MKEFFEIMQKDFLQENFSKREWVIYGVIMPVAMVAVCLIGSIIAAA